VTPDGRVRALLWVWVAAAFALYLLQFRPLMGPVLKTLGIL
jgi:hypothetical protein